MSAPASSQIRRDTGRALLGGVLAGVAGRAGVDPVIVRVAFAVTVVASGGLTLLAYLVAWAAMPATGGASPALARLTRMSVRSRWRVAVGVGFLSLAALLAFRELGIWWSDALAWPLVLAAFGAALLWTRARGAEPTTTPTASAGRAPADGDPAPERSAPSDATAPGAPGSNRFADLYRGGFGVLLVIGAALLFLSSNHILGGLRDAALTTVVVVVSLSLILAPFLWRLGRNLATERAERIRSQERAEVAAHLHDSVLQTLTLMQKRAGDPREVAALARRQERELRNWLAGGQRRGADSSLASALRAAAEEVEDEHRVAVEAVVVGDQQIDERSAALVDAAREALVNAAKHAGAAGSIRLYAEVENGLVEVFIRDRGPGFDPAAVPADRRGVRESIIGRMERAGGRADIRAVADGGTEVALSIGSAQARRDGGGA